MTVRRGRYPRSSHLSLVAAPAAAPLLGVAYPAQTGWTPGECGPLPPIPDEWYPPDAVPLTAAADDVTELEDVRDRHPANGGAPMPELAVERRDWIAGDPARARQALTDEQARPRPRRIVVDRARQVIARG